MYNNRRSEEYALRCGIESVNEFANVYTTNVIRKDGLRVEWREMLYKLGNKYRKSQQSEETFKNDVQELVDHINSLFSGFFDNTNRPQGVPKGFLLAHAQISLSVYLKHMWCMNKFATPPVCPISKKILGRDCEYVHTIDQYDRDLEDVKKKRSSEEGLAEWELFDMGNTEKTDNPVITQNIGTQNTKWFKEGDYHWRNDYVVVDYIIPINGIEFRLFVGIEGSHSRGRKNIPPYRYYCELQTAKHENIPYFEKILNKYYIKKRSVKQNIVGWWTKTDYKKPLAYVIFDETEDGKKNALVLMKNILTDTKAPQGTEQERQSAIDNVSVLISKIHE